MSAITASQPIRVPPGPKGLPVLGSLFDFRRDRLSFLTKCARDYGPVVRFHVGPRTTYLFSRPEAIEDILVNKSHAFTKTPFLREGGELLGNGLLTSEGDFWRRQRRLAQPAFHRDRIAAYGQTMVGYTQAMLAVWRDGETRDLRAEMMRLTLRIVAKCLFDAEVAHEAEGVGEALELALARFNQRSSGLALPDWLPTPHHRRYQAGARRLNAIIYHIIAERRTGGKDTGDLLSMLLHAQDEDGSHMTDKQLHDEVMTLFLAGHETTANTLSFTGLLLAQNPAVEAKLLAELNSVLGGRLPTVEDIPNLPYAERIVLEAMRLYPPAWLMARQAKEECEIAGYHIPAGAILMMSQWVMQRDPHFFPDPEKFEPDRWLDNLADRLPKYVYFPFGAGQRMCIGKPFAMQEAILLLAAIAQQFQLSPVPGFQVELQASVTLRPRHGLQMQLSQRR